MRRTSGTRMSSLILYSDALIAHSFRLENGRRGRPDGHEQSASVPCLRRRRQFQGFGPAGRRSPGPRGYGWPPGCDDPRATAGGAAGMRRLPRGGGHPRPKAGHFLRRVPYPRRLGGGDDRPYVTRFPLTGRHLLVECEACHVDRQWTGIGMACLSCHSPDDSHRGQFSVDCSDCHTTNGWDDLTFSHAETGLRLEGGTPCRPARTATPAGDTRGHPPPASAATPATTGTTASSGPTAAPAIEPPGGRTGPSITTSQPSR